MNALLRKLELESQAVNKIIHLTFWNSTFEFEFDLLLPWVQFNNTGGSQWVRYCAHEIFEHHLACDLVGLFSDKRFEDRVHPKYQVELWEHRDWINPLLLVSERSNSQNSSRYRGDWSSLLLVYSDRTKIGSTEFEYQKIMSPCTIKMLNLSFCCQS